MLALDWPASGPLPQVTSKALPAVQAWPKVSAITATPTWRSTITPLGGTTTTSSTPGMALTVLRLLTLTSVPRICVGMRNTVGTALGTAWSIVNFLRPVTMSSASNRLAGLPTTVYCEVGLICTPAGSGSDAAKAANAL